MRYVTTLNDEQIYSCQKITHDLWGHGRTLKARYEQLKANLGPELSMAGLVDCRGEVQSSLKRYALTLSFEKRIIPCIGLGAVFTSERARGQGLAQELIEKTLHEARLSSIPIALLFSDIDEEYYQQLGFRALDAFNMSIFVDDLRTRVGKAHYRPARPEETDQLANFYNSAFADNCVRSFRDRKKWAFMRSINGPVVEMIMSEANDDIGYVTYSIDKKSHSLRLFEFVIAEEKEDELLSFLYQQALINNVQEINGWKPYQKLKNISPQLTRRKNAVPMICSFNPHIDFHRISTENFYFGLMDSF